jgi:glycerol-3-phosphate dehydrogenase (NAD(P)+)
VSRIAVIGAGAWGTALAMVAGRRGDHQVHLWALEKEVSQAVSETRCNSVFLPDCPLPAGVTATNDFQAALDSAEIVVSVMPSHHCRRTFEHMAQWLRPQMLFVSATKGIENDTFLRMSEVIDEVVKRFCGFAPQLAALSGPSFAREVAQGSPTAVTVASAKADSAARVQKDFTDPSFRIYVNDDLVGVELGGALKNVIAIAAGLCDSLALGENARAALVTRGLAEIARLGVALGASARTFAGLAGLGDLVLTATGSLSRNRALGLAIGQGKTLREAEASTRTVAEGARTVASALRLARAAGVSLPICAAVAAVLFDGTPVAEALAALLAREPRPEEEEVDVSRA